MLYCFLTEIMPVLVCIMLTAAVKHHHNSANMYLPQGGVLKITFMSVVNKTVNKSVWDIV